MDPIQKMWMYENWIADQNEDAELAKNHAYLLASFSNPEAVKQLMGEGNTHTSTEEEFDESTRMIKQINDEMEHQKNEKAIPKKKRRRLSKG